MKPLRIGLLSPWYGGSHKQWADGLRRSSHHMVDIFGLPARNWKWRMHGAAVTLAQQVISSQHAYDLFLADDMMDVAVFSALIKQGGNRAPVCTYFHENQLCYPVSPADTDSARDRDEHYAYVNFTTALASEAVYFNSNYHMQSFLSSLGTFLARMPDGNHGKLVSSIERKSRVLPLGMDLQSLELDREILPVANQRPLILWNHRWEYDKGIDEFLRLLLDLYASGVQFDVALLGERVGDPPVRLAEVENKLGERILVNGKVEDFKKYARWLWCADIVPVTAIQDFFGISVVEAMFCGCHVILPDRLAYPEHAPSGDSLYRDYPELLERVLSLIRSGNWKNRPVRTARIDGYDWRQLIEKYDSAFSDCLNRPVETGR